MKKEIKGFVIYSESFNLAKEGKKEEIDFGLYDEEGRHDGILKAVWKNNLSFKVDMEGFEVLLSIPNLLSKMRERVSDVTTPEKFMNFLEDNGFHCVNKLVDKAIEKTLREERVIRSS